MIRNRTIICLASAWDYDPTSKHQVMKRLAARNRILWVNYHGTRRPSVTGGDVRASLAALRRVARGVQPVPAEQLAGVPAGGAGMWQLTPLVIPGTHTGLAGWSSERLLLAQLRRGLRLVQGDDPLPVQVWSFAPDVPYLVGRFNEECFLYYCVDEYREFEGLDQARVAAAEDALLDRADVVVTTSAGLQASKSVHRPDAQLVRHGVDHAHFSTAWRKPLPRPADLAGIPEPVFGFFGLIHHWVDVALLAEVARLRPQYSFVLLGDARVDVSALTALPNVYLLGRKPYAELPAYCRAFAAGLLLFTRTAMTTHVNPIKLLEYLAAGLRIISTPLPEAERFRGPIRIVDTAARFAQACDELRAGGHIGRREEISRLAQSSSWEAVVARLSSIVTTDLASRAATPRPDVAHANPAPALVSAPAEL